MNFFLIHETEYSFIWLFVIDVATPDGGDKKVRAFSPTKARRWAKAGEIMGGFPII